MTLPSLRVERRSRQTSSCSAQATTTTIGVCLAPPQNFNKSHTSNAHTPLAMPATRLLQAVCIGTSLPLVAHVAPPLRTPLPHIWYPSPNSHSLYPPAPPCTASGLPGSCPVMSGASWGCKRMGCTCTATCSLRAFPGWRLWALRWPRSTT